MRKWVKRKKVPLIILYFPSCAFRIPLSEFLSFITEIGLDNRR